VEVLKCWNFITKMGNWTIQLIPIDLDNPIKHKDTVIKIRGHEAIHSAKALGDRIFVRIDTTAATDFCEATYSVLNNCDARIKEYKFFGIVKIIDKAYAGELFCVAMVLVMLIGLATRSQ